MQLLEAVRASGTAGDMPDKALKQMVLPFARTKMEGAVKGGAQVLHFHALMIVAELHCCASPWRPHFGSLGTCLRICLHLCLGCSLGHACNSCG